MTSSFNCDSKILLVLAFIVGCYSDARAQTTKGINSRPDRIVLTWNGNPANTQSVTWRTMVNITNPVAQIAPATPAPNLEEKSISVQAVTQRVEMENDEVVFYHSATFTDLLPGSLYAYRVGAENEPWSEWNHFQTVDTTSAPFSFLYLGDVQTNIHSLGSRTIRAGYSKAPDAEFMLFAGDLVNNGHDKQQWEEWFAALGWIPSTMRIVPVTGNHDYDFLDKDDKEKKLSRFWKTQFELPVNGPKGLEESAYYLDIKDMRLVVLNSNIALKSPAELKRQTQWLESALSNHDKKWTVVSYHHPLFSARDGKHGDNPELRAAWEPVFERYGVDLVLQGHDHIYGRSYKKHLELNGSYKAGPVYVVSVAGAKMYGIVPAKRWMDRGSVNAQFYQIITIDGDKLSFRAYMVNNQLYDSFDLIKNHGGKNQFIEYISSEDHPEHLFEDNSSIRN